MENPITPSAAPVYAGFWMRFLAYIIDDLIISVVALIILLPLGGVMGLGAFFGMNATPDQFSDEATAGLAVAMMSAVMLMVLVVSVLQWLYFAIMESSVRQATLGKMALGLLVTDMHGNRLSFGRATGRYFGKIISGAILMIGYIMAGFTQQKQALHDILAGCLVVRK
jgi:uncharacterized RDD family membrane protein YckC